VELRQLLDRALHQAALDWRAEEFPQVPGDEQEFIPLPEGKPKIVSYP
jgi:hypothetical protein